MQTTSALYKSIVASDNHWFETKLTIGGQEITESQIMSISRETPGMSENRPTVGGALSARLVATIIKPNFTIARMASIAVSVRACDASRQSEWLPSGTFFIDTRSHSKTSSALSTITLTAFDAMMKAEADYPDTQHEWPYLDKNVVAEIAAAIGVTVDARTNKFLTSGYMINLPSEYTMRETLEHIAACYGGNFVITKDNQLLFIPLYGLENQEKGYYLADENGNALEFGNEGWFILV